ncbi:MAG: polyprenyl synthetase family protein [Bacteroidetes Order II. Incertae sedis bacterium]|nr:polyprenyl synthetase family protein [Bacteroidetes Order II. bacterium]
MHPQEHIQALSGQVEAALKRLTLPDYPPDLYAPVRYTLEAGGKRIRPVCVLLAAELYGVSLETAMPAALAVEVFHNFTLLHDDIMDRADTRRGRPTVHRKWDENVAILSGDLMMGMSYDLLAQTGSPRLGIMIRQFHKMVMRLCEGQMLDMVFEKRMDVHISEYLDMIDGKTAALLRCAFELGGLLGGASDEDRDALGALGQHIGIGFQVQDDLLDLTAPIGFGKQKGGDLMQGKRTWLLLTALERASGPDLAFLQRTLTGGMAESEIPRAEALMEALEVTADAAKLAETQFLAAQSVLLRLPSSPVLDTLQTLIQSLQHRKQ